MHVYKLSIIVQIKHDSIYKINIDLHKFYNVMFIIVSPLILFFAVP
jgi:hypothetical protein